MKFYSCILLLTITFSVFSQTEDNDRLISNQKNFELKNLSNILEKYDRNKNGALDDDEKKNVVDLKINGEISSTELLKFSNIESLSLTSSKLETLDLSSFKNLKSLYLASNFNLKNLMAHDLATLSQIKIIDSPIEVLKIDKSVNIQNIFINKGNLGSLNLNSLQKAEDIQIYNSMLYEISVDSLLNLKYLYLDGNRISNIILPNSTVLETVSLNTNQLSSIGLQHVPNLKKLRLSENQIDKIDISKLNDLVYLELTQNNLTSFKTENNNKLASIFLEKNKLTELNLSNWIGFKDSEATQPQILYIHYNPIKTLNIKNGKLTRVFCDKVSLSKIKITKDDIDDLAPKS